MEGRRGLPHMDSTGREEKTLSYCFNMDGSALASSSHSFYHPIPPRRTHSILGSLCIPQNLFSGP